ncbi:hypothetical protein GQ457_06G023850 [Hibiscus cannabinus]
MQSTIQLKPQFLHSKTCFFLNPYLESKFSIQEFNYSSKSPIFTASLLFSRKTQIQKPAICARKSKRRHGSRISTNVALELISILASHLKILPPPLDLVLRHLVAADGEGLEYFNGFDGGRFYPWKRRRVSKIVRNLFLGFLVIVGSCIVCLLLGKELRSDIIFGILGLIFFVFALIKEWRRRFKDCIFGFVCVGFLLGLGLREMKWVKEIRVPHPSLMEIVRRDRRGKWTL